MGALHSSHDHCAASDALRHANTENKRHKAAILVPGSLCVEGFPNLYGVILVSKFISPK